MENEIIESQPSEIILHREPETVLTEAKKAAQALMTVVSQKKKPVIINNEQYLEFEDWQTVARFYGLTVKVNRTNFVDFGGVKGYEAVADVLRNDGTVISSAEAMCLNDEEKWSTRTKYEWINGKREKIGEVPVPLFQIRSMAQTRACAKALRNVLAWVVVLAGFKPTPAEEMTDGINQGQPSKPEIKPPQKKQTATAEVNPQIKAVDIVTLAQAKVGDKMNVFAYAQKSEHKQFPKKDKTGIVDITTYSVSDLPENATVSINIKVWGAQEPCEKGQALVFENVVVGEYKGNPDYLAERIIKNV